MSMHTVCTDTSAKNLPLSDRRCIEATDCCDAFKAAHEASQAAVSYNRQFEYGHWLSWYFAIFIFIFALFHGVELWRAHRSLRNIESKDQHPTWWNCVVAGGRFIGYRRPPGKVADWLDIPSYGVLSLLSLGIFFISMLTFLARPYYREHRGYGSPPIAVRTGLMAAACIPFLIVLSGKANLVSLLTGIGHEKLNVVHRWVGWASFALSVVHTIPFLRAPLHDGGYAALRKQFYKEGALEYTGTPPFAIHFGIVVLSIPWIRHRLHSIFYSFHWLLAITYLGLCFWHFKDEGDSWNYLWATIALWLTSILARVFIKNQTAVSGALAGVGMGMPVTLESMHGGMSRILVPVPQGFIWLPGQHAFVRFPGLSIMGNHPFSIMNGPPKPLKSIDANISSDSLDDQPTLQFLVRTRSGLTRELQRHISQTPAHSLTAYIDGPYSGLNTTLVSSSHQVILIAGGGGITAIIPWLQYLVTGMRHNTIRTTNISFVWVVREKEHLCWVSDALSQLFSDAPKGGLDVTFYITRQLKDSSKRDPESDLEKRGGEASMFDRHSELEAQRIQYERPFFKDMLPSMIDTSGRTTVVDCGPRSLITDISNGVAQAQRKVLSGSVSSIALHTEAHTI